MSSPQHRLTVVGGRILMYEGMIEHTCEEIEELERRIAAKRAEAIQYAESLQRLYDERRDLMTPEDEAYINSRNAERSLARE